MAASRPFQSPPPALQSTRREAWDQAMRSGLAVCVPQCSAGPRPLHIPNAGWPDGVWGQKLEVEATQLQTASRGQLSVIKGPVLEAGDMQRKDLSCKGQQHFGQEGAATMWPWRSFCQKGIWGKQPHGHSNCLSKVPCMKSKTPGSDLPLLFYEVIFGMSLTWVPASHPTKESDTNIPRNSCEITRNDVNSVVNSETLHEIAYFWCRLHKWYGSLYSLFEN